MAGVEVPEVRLPGEAAARGQCRGSAGEIWQGPVDDSGGLSRIGIVTLPINRYSTAIFYADSRAEIEPLSPKRALAVGEFERRTGLLTPPGRWEFHSDLFPGRGMASSTADVVAILRCLADLHHYPISPLTLQSVLLTIERSDPVFVDAWSLYLSSAQEVQRVFASALAFTVCFGFDPGNIRTNSFSESTLTDHYRRRHQKYAHSLSDVITALEEGNVALLASGATASAWMAQDYLPSPLVAGLLEDYEHLGASGIFRAHTGTLSGLIFEHPPDAEKRSRASNYFASRGSQMIECQGGNAW